MTSRSRVSNRFRVLARNSLPRRLELFLEQSRDTAPPRASRVGVAEEVEKLELKTEVEGDLEKQSKKKPGIPAPTPPCTEPPTSAADAVPFAASAGIAVGGEARAAPLQPLVALSQSPGTTRAQAATQPSHADAGPFGVEAPCA